MSPGINNLRPKIDHFFSGRMSPSEVTEFLRRYNVDWVFIGEEEQGYGINNLDNVKSLRKEYTIGRTMVYSVQLSTSQ